VSDARLPLVPDAVDLPGHDKPAPAPRRPTASELLVRPGALMTRSDLRELGLERRAIDAVFRECPVVVLPGYSRPMVQVEAYLALLEGSTYCDPLRGPRAAVSRDTPGRARTRAGTAPLTRPPSRLRPTPREVPIAMGTLRGRGAERG
jgi:hypothetical protein